MGGAEAFGAIPSAADLLLALAGFETGRGGICEIMKLKTATLARLPPEPSLW